jgi:hypothetical protein
VNSFFNSDFFIPENPADRILSRTFPSADMSLRINFFI